MSERTGVYFIVAASGPVKIGLSTNPKERVSDLATAHYERLVLIHVVWCRTREHAFEIEGAFHRWYSERRMMNEWYAIQLDELVSDIAFLVRIADRSLFEFEWIVDPQKFAKAAAAQAVKRQARNQRAMEIALSYYRSNPDALDLDPRELVDVVGVKKSTLYTARKQVREEIDNGRQ